MGHKVFVSYKYKDYDVKKMPNVTQPTWPCDYVDYIQNNVLSSKDVYKGENSDEDISSWSEERIWSHLKDKIYDSSITIVLISPNMSEYYVAAEPPVRCGESHHSGQTEPPCY